MMADYWRRNDQGTCEKLIPLGERGRPVGDRQCGKPAALRYPTLRGGWMHLCPECGQGHEAYSQRWDGAEWTPAPGYYSTDDLLRRARHWIWLAAPHQEADGQAVAAIDLRAIEETLNLPEAERRWRQLAGL